VFITNEVSSSFLGLHGSLELGKTLALEDGLEFLLVDLT